MLLRYIYNGAALQCQKSIGVSNVEKYGEEKKMVEKTKWFVPFCVGNTDFAVCMLTFLVHMSLLVQFSLTWEKKDQKETSQSST